jgi:hypothetical protein
VWVRFPLRVQIARKLARKRLSLGGVFWFQILAQGASNLFGRWFNLALSQN